MALPDIRLVPDVGREFKSLRPRDSTGGELSAGSGDGTSDGMEARVAHLEASVSHLERDVGELRTDMRDVRDRLLRVEERMATKTGTFLAAGSIIAAIAAFTTFQDQIRGMLGLG